MQRRDESSFVAARRQAALRKNFSERTKAYLQQRPVRTEDAARAAGQRAYRTHSGA